MPMSRNTAAIVGFITAPLVPAVVFAVLTPLATEPDIPTLLGFALVFYFFSAIAILLLGAPIYFLLRHFDLVNWWSTLGCGIVAGAVVGVVEGSSSVQLHGLLVFSAVGAASAFSFWLVWRQGREA